MTARDGSTPLSPDELADLIPSLATKQELNEWERENILQARTWALRDRTSPQDMISDDYVRKLHCQSVIFSVSIRTGRELDV